MGIERRVYKGDGNIAIDIDQIKQHQQYFHNNSKLLLKTRSIDISNSKPTNPNQVCIDLSRLLESIANINPRLSRPTKLLSNVSTNHNYVQQRCSYRSMDLLPMQLCQP